MVQITFNYCNNKTKFKFNNSILLEEAFETFSNKMTFDINGLFFIYDHKNINSDSNLTLGQKFGKNNMGNIEILVITEIPMKIIFNLYQVKKEYDADRNEKMIDIIKFYALKIKKTLNNLTFLYNGTYFNYNDNRTVYNYADGSSRTNNKIIFLVTEAQDIYNTVMNNNNINFNNININNNFNNININNNFNNINFNNNFNTFNSNNNGLNNINFFNNNILNNNYNLNNINISNNYNFNNSNNFIEKNLNNYNLNNNKYDNFISNNLNNNFINNYNNNNDCIIDNNSNENNNQNMFNNEENELDQPLIRNEEVPQGTCFKCSIRPYSEEKHFLAINFRVLTVQHVFILLFIFLGSFYKFNKELLKVPTSISIIILILFLIMAFIFNELFQEYKNSRYMIIFYVIYPFLISYYCLLLSKFFDSMYIIIGSSLVLIEILSIAINLIFFKNYEIKNKLIYYGISSSALSLIGLILFATLWIKLIIPSIFVSIFWILSNILYILWVLAISKLCGLEDYFYSILIFNFGIFIGLAYGISFITKKLYKFVMKKKEENDLRSSLFLIFFILSGEYLIISLFISIAFPLNLNSFVHTSSFDAVMTANIIFTVLNTILFIIKYYSKTYTGKTYYFLIGGYTIFMFMFYFLFSSFVREIAIISVVFIIFFNLVTISIFLALIKSENFTLYIFLACLASDVITIPFCYFLLMKTELGLMVSISISICVASYLSGIICYLKKKDDDNESYYIEYNVALYDYGLFSFAIIVIIVGVLLFVATQSAQS